MAELTENKLQDVIKNCKWRQDFGGVAICTGACAPCNHIIESGKCDTLRKLVYESRKEDEQNG